MLQAAHIMPYADGGTHDVTNGLLLRSHIHCLFDLGYVTVTPEYRFKVFRRTCRGLSQRLDVLRRAGQARGGAVCQVDAAEQGAARVAWGERVAGVKASGWCGMVWDGSLFGVRPWRGRESRRVSSGG